MCHSIHVRPSSRRGKLNSAKKLALRCHHHRNAAALHPGGLPGGCCTCRHRPRADGGRRDERLGTSSWNMPSPQSRHRNVFVAARALFARRPPGLLAASAYSAPMTATDERNARVGAIQSLLRCSLLAAGCTDKHYHPRHGRRQCDVRPSAQERPRFQQVQPARPGCDQGGRHVQLQRGVPRSRPHEPGPQRAGVRDAFTILFTTNRRATHPRARSSATDDCGSGYDCGIYKCGTYCGIEDQPGMGGELFAGANVGGACASPRCAV